MIEATRVLTLLCLTLLRRLLREGMVVRSLVSPTAIVAGTLLVTLMVLVAVRTGESVALPPDLVPTLEADVRSLGMEPVAHPEPRAAVTSGRASAGWDGETLWLSVSSPRTVALEGLLRERERASWVPVPPEQIGRNPETRELNRLGVQLMALLFSLYGVVFGAGMVVRDRDDGTLEAELSLPVPTWVHGLARWMAGSLCITAFYALSLLILHAMVEVPDVPALLRHGVAASATATAVGLLAVAWTRRGSGFSTTLAGGLSGVTGLVGIGWAVPSLSGWLPLASVTSSGSGWAPLAVSVATGILAVASFSYRVSR